MTDASLDGLAQYALNSLNLNNNADTNLVSTSSLVWSLLQTLLLVHKCMYHKYRLSCIFRNYFELNMNVHKYSNRGSNDLHVAAVMVKEALNINVVSSGINYLVILNITL